LQVGLFARALAWAVMILAVFAGRLLDPLLGWEVGDPWAWRLVGLVVLAVSVRGAMVTGRYLAVYGGSRRGVTSRVVDKGPYACMRHPMHFFLALFPVGLGLVLASPGSLLVGLVEWALILVLAVFVDERDALARLGREYEEYRGRVPAYSLDPRCLRRALGRRPPKGSSR